MLQNEVDEEVGQYEYDEYVDTQVSMWYHLLEKLFNILNRKT